MSHGHAVPQASALLPCPFCGSNDIERSNSGDPHRTAFWTCCNECGTSTGEGGVYSQDQADARWNRRASQAPAAIAEPASPAVSGAELPALTDSAIDKESSAYLHRSGYRLHDFDIQQKVHYGFVAGAKFARAILAASSRSAGASPAVSGDETSDEFERGRQQGMKQEHALWKLARSSDELERRPSGASPAAVEALRELVSCKDLKEEELRLRQRRPVLDVAKITKCNLMRVEHRRRASLAWEAARAALADPEQAQTKGEKP
jgi:Lar family restriction alleviation protein